MILTENEQFYMISNKIERLNQSINPLAFKEIIAKINFISDDKNKMILVNYLLEKNKHLLIEISGELMSCKSNEDFIIKFFKQKKVSKKKLLDANNYMLYVACFYDCKKIQEYLIDIGSRVENIQSRIQYSKEDISHASNYQKIIECKNKNEDILNNIEINVENIEKKFRKI